MSSLELNYCHVEILSQLRRVVHHLGALEFSFRIAKYHTYRKCQIPQEQKSLSLILYGKQVIPVQLYGRSPSPNIC